jgi:S1-C subfamily serine protease
LTVIRIIFVVVLTAWIMNCTTFQVSAREGVEASTVFIQVGYMENNVFTAVEEGSGFVVHETGWVISAKHVLEAAVPANKVRVYFGSLGSRFDQKYEMFDVPGPLLASDFGLHRFPPDVVKKWPPLKILIGHQFSKGDPVTASGFPMGMEITTKGGTVTNTFGPNGAIGTGAGLAFGMSGGPVVLGNSHCVVGIVTAGANYPGFDFFTPTQLAKALLDVPPATFVSELVGLLPEC